MDLAYRSGSIESLSASGTAPAWASTWLWFSFSSQNCAVHLARTKASTIVVTSINLQQSDGFLNFRNPLARASIAVRGARAFQVAFHLRNGLEELDEMRALDGIVHVLWHGAGRSQKRQVVQTHGHDANHIAQT